MKFSYILALARYIIENPAIYQRGLALIDQWQDAKTNGDKLRVVAAAATLFADFVDNLPPFESFGSIEDEQNAEETLQFAAARINIDWNKLLDIVKILLPIILPLFIDDEDKK